MRLIKSITIFYLNLLGIRKDKRFAHLFNGFIHSAKDSRVSISKISKVYIDVQIDRFSLPIIDISILLTHYGYDISEENYINGYYTSGVYKVKDVQDLLKFSAFLERKFKLDINKHEDYFYNSERMLKSVR